MRIVTGAAGTSGDWLTRYLSQRLNEKWGRPVIVDSRTGGEEWLLRQGAEPAASTPVEFTAFMQQEIVKWGKVMRAAGIRAE